MDSTRLQMPTDLARDTWRIFKILAEFVEGFETLQKIGPAVSVFGSARTKPTSPIYQQAVECGRRLAQAGFAVITGGGPGVMEAAHRGCFEAGGKSVGLNISLPMEQMPNPYQNYRLTFDHFFIRKVMFVKYASAFICFPGGYGTMDELFEALTLIQTDKIEPFPVVLVGTRYWQGLLDWLRHTMCDGYGHINPDDLRRFHVTDDIDEAVELVSKCFEGKCWLGPRPAVLPAAATEQTAEGTRVGVNPLTHQAAGQHVNVRELRQYPPKPQQ